MDINLLVNLTARAWSIGILAAMYRGVPGRQAALLNATGAGRTAFAQSLQHLMEIGLMERNPGHGHPLRPEYRLTALGQSYAEIAAYVENQAEGGNIGALIRRRWTLPVLAQIRRPRNFSDIRARLAPITDRALSQSLKALEAERCVARLINPTEWPVRPSYRARGAGAEIARLL